MNKSKQYNVYISTDVGKVRSNNEDNFTVNTTIRNSSKNNQNMRGLSVNEPMLCAVFDGMGGEMHGEDASEISALIAVEFYKYLKKDNLNPCDYINSYVRECNREIINNLKRLKASRGGSTFTMAYCSNGTIKMFSLGDSRIYLYSDSCLKQISTDHTLAMKKYKANIYTLKEAQASSDKHKLVAFLGLEKENNPIMVEQYDPVVLNKGDKLMMCSDGLYDMCSDDEISEILKTDSDKVGAMLVQRALENGGEDNVTCIVIEVA